MKIEIYIKTYKGDFELLAYCLRSLNRFGVFSESFDPYSGNGGFAGVTLVCDAGESDELEAVIRHAAEADGDPVFPFRIRIKEAPAFDDNPDLKWGPTGAGYCFQKAIKVRWVDYAPDDTDACVQIDSDCILTRRFSPAYFYVFVAEGIPAIAWFVRPWKEATIGERNAWEEGHKYIYGEECQRLNYMICPGFFITRELAKQATARLYAQFLQHPEEFFLDPKHPKVSVYNFLGQVAEANLVAGYVFVHASKEMLDTNPIKQFWSWAGADKHRDKIESILASEKTLTQRNSYG